MQIQDQPIHDNIVNKGLIFLDDSDDEWRRLMYHAFTMLLDIQNSVFSILLC